MEVGKIPKIEYRGEFVLSTSQIATCYKCKPENIRWNFKAGRKNFVEGIHYFKIEGDALREFKEYVSKIWAKSNCEGQGENFPSPENNGAVKPSSPEIPVSKLASSVIVWTLQGAVRHCKMVGTKEAWDMFDKLEQSYFKSEEREPLKIETPFEVEEAEEVETIKIDNRLLLDVLKLISDDALRDKLIIRIAEKIMGEKLL